MDFVEKNLKKPEKVKTYWWNGIDNTNFGDVLGPALFEHFTGKKAIWTPTEDSDLVIIGSIMEHIKYPYFGTVAGIGVANKRTTADLSAANVLALRGELTLERTVVSGQPLLADPGLLATDLLINRPPVSYSLGVIAHHADRTLAVPPNALSINIRGPISQVITEAAQCSKIVTSSLHGLILADALGIPRMWKSFSRVQGVGFKFHDYASSLGMTIRPGTWDLADKNVVEKKQDQLREMFSCL
jgi:pyruvyltransferase